MNIKSKKSLGQNFLIDKNIIKKISEAKSINNDNEILEIGPGTGNLTDYLIKKKPKNLFLIEKDKNLSDYLKSKYDENIKIYNDDILNFNLKKILTKKTIVFGNLPYNISSQILINFILNKENIYFDSLIFMFQKELADRIIAKINTSDYGRLTILTNWKFNVKKIFDINPNSFYPKPKVKSSLLIFTPKKDFFYFKSSESLEKITRICFNKRRKKIKNQLNFLFNNNIQLVKNLNIDLNLRPQNIKSETYFRLAQEYEKLRN